MGFPKGQKRDFKLLERRRFKAARLFERGCLPADVARQCGVSCQSEMRWQATCQAGGLVALKKAAQPRRPSRLTAERLQELQTLLKQGPSAHEFATELWTAQRVAYVIHTRFGILYHPDHVCRLLGQLGWSCQRPSTREIQRDETAIGRWKRTTWPALKKVLNEGRIPVFVDESGLSQKPHRVRTWAPRGQTPVLEFDFNWKKLKVMAGITVWNFYFRLYPSAIRSPQVIDFLQHLQA